MKIIIKKKLIVVSSIYGIYNIDIEKRDVNSLLYIYLYIIDVISI